MTSTGPEAPAPAAPANWAWAQQARPTRVVETEPLEYHRLYRGVTSYRWWKPLVVALLAATFYLLATLVVSAIWVALILVQNPDLLGGDPLVFADALTAELALDTQKPLSILMGLLSVIVMIPSVWLTMLVMGVRPRGRVWSVALKIRWKLLFACIGLAVGAVFLMNLLGIALELAFDPSLLEQPGAGSGSAETQAPAFDFGAALLSMLFVVLLMPLQATAEELMFRGMLAQVVGAWTKNPGLYISVSAGYALLAGAVFFFSGGEGFTSFAIVSAVFAALALVAGRLTGSPFLPIFVPSLLFALMHIYTFWGMLAVGLMGLVAAWTTWRTGGLEAAIAIHVMNNLVAFGFMAAAIGGETAQTADAGGGPGSAIGQLLGLLLYAWIVAVVFRAGRYGRTRIDLVEVPVETGWEAPPAESAQGVPGFAPQAPVAIETLDTVRAPGESAAPDSDGGRMQPGGAVEDDGAKEHGGAAKHDGAVEHGGAADSGSSDAEAARGENR
ncbi:CPBP family intramembrane glutamic endopeptidase [Leucobacter ruminantium]|uniref:CPBP family intramembrane metalloprotease n=1 Tax=Leucobacter ruminantium TaxID=1289170 RepID=A0A939LUE6_9MICO|nr:type II CAAX endopeptidase family protein [Leucobacter ruminantium]MBO1804964.1 CPBP family intramembrane metalloprotease [Leucobacter ruminantium]